VGELDPTQGLEQGRDIHAEAAAVALAQPVPAVDRVVGRAAEGLDGAGLGRLQLVGGAEVDPVALLDTRVTDGMPMATDGSDQD
jgi:hypothetical protein